MRPLNRPMFRYGGPIKEGIMNGMKDRTIAGGNQVGTPMGDRTGFADPRRQIFKFLPGVSKIYDRGIANLKKIPGFFKSKIGKEVIDVDNPNIVRDSLGNVISRTTQTKFVPNYLGRDPAVKLIGSAYKGITSPTAKGFGQKAAQFATSPTALITGATLTDALPGGDPLFGTRNIFGQKFDPETGIKTEGLFGRDLPAKKQLEELNAQRQELAAKKKIKEKKDNVIDPTKKINRDEEIQANRERYYKIIGIDKMKKDAAYDSLIDASKIVQEEGADLKGAVKSGALQNRIIQAISKNLDKSADIKRQIDAAILKGEITKDIAAADTTDKRLKEARIKQLDRAEKQAGASGVIASVIAKDGTITGSQTAAILRADGVDYDNVIQDKLFTDYKKDNPTKDEANYIASLGVQLPDGRYVVGARLVEKKGNEVAFIV